jgi:cytochrome P450
LQTPSSPHAPSRILFTSASPPPSAERLAKSPLLRRITTVRMVWRARKNLLEAFHPSAWDKRWHISNIASGKVVTANDPDLARHVLKDRADAFGKGRMYEAIFGEFLGKSSLTMEGETWRTRRRLISPAFNARALRRLDGLVARHVGLMLADWDAAIGAGQSADIDISRAATGLALRVAMEAFFSSDLGADEDRIAALMEEVILDAGSPSIIDLLGLPTWLPRGARTRRRTMLAELDGVLYPLIDARMAGRGKDLPDAPDLLDILIHAQDDETGAHLDRTAVRNEVMTLFAAGHETTALSLAWGLDRLAREQDWQDRLAAAAAAGPDAGGKPDPLLPGAYDEMLRLYPPAFIVGREAVTESQFEDIHFNPGDRVQVAIFMMHRDPRWWDAPEAFDPTRFLPAARAGRHPFAYIPFGAGPRICVGLALAKMEGLEVLRAALPRFRLTAIGAPPSPLGRITLRTEAPVIAKVSRR